MTTDSVFHQRFESFQVTCDIFKRFLSMEENSVVRDACLFRFKLTFALSWKLIKAWLAEDKGLICSSPKDCFRQAFQQGLIDYDDFWITMVDYRNQASHTCHETLVEEIYEQLPQALAYFLSLKSDLGRIVQ